MTYSVSSMENSFLMTNISPQIPRCNMGETLDKPSTPLSNKIRKTLYFPKAPPVMGKAAIPVLEAFYKAVHNLTHPMIMIGCIDPNKTRKCRIADFTVSVDEVERITGYDFFSNLEDKLEKKKSSCIA